MFKKLIFYISFSFLIIYNYSELYAEVKNIIPLKKPFLDKITIENKLTQGILKPLAKPNKDKEKIKTVEIVKKKKIKPKFLIPKKKPLIVNANNKFNIAFYI